IERLDASGLDGRELTEIGLQGGNLTVDDQRNGKQWTFTNIDLSVTRPKGGGIAVALGSHSLERPWHLRAAMTPGQQGHRIIDIDDPLVRVPIDRAEISLDWDKSRRALVAPFQVVSGGTRITLLAQFESPHDGSGIWGLQISGGGAVLASAPVDPHALVLNRVLLRMRINPAKQRIDLDPSEVGNTDRGIAISGSLDFSCDG